MAQLPEKIKHVVSFPIDAKKTPTKCRLYIELAGSLFVSQFLTGTDQLLFRYAIQFAECFY